VTWSNDEYAHAGLRAQYLRLKSLQRFSETYNLVDRACAQDAEAASVVLGNATEALAQHHEPPLRVASLGGGPAFELVAVREFVRARRHALRRPERRLEFFSLDLQPAWKPYAEAVGCTFVAPFDVLQATADALLSAVGGRPLDVLVISYLLIYCTNDRTADLLADVLRRNIARVLFISERTDDQAIVAKLEQRGLVVVPLLTPQSAGGARDERQLLVLRRDRRRPTGRTAPPDGLAFPNVPFARGT